ncbi:MAG: sulfatase-like hydrolase/transferase [Verrucomicrobiales bacterium]|nr:sulfatase-like hydrolase/transferase [Verrucomicrobiales bacterium]
MKLCDPVHVNFSRRVKLRGKHQLPLRTWRLRVAHSSELPDCTLYSPGPNRVQFPVILPIFLILLLFPLSVASGETQKPDVLIILCDDFNPFYTGFSGDPDARTPHIDSLAKQSAVFTNCYSASAVCMPARTSLVTGLYPHNTGCWGNATDLFVSPGLTSMFSDFKQAGYSTSVIGKTHWYAGNGFKEQFGSKKEYFSGIGIDFFRDVATTFSSRSGSGIYQDYLRRNGLFEKQSADLTDRLKHNQYIARASLLQPEQTCDRMMTDLAIDYLHNAPKSRPYIMMVGFSNPHSPFDPPGKYATMYDPESMSLRPNVKPFKKYGTNYSPDEIRKARAAYLGKISLLDDLVGRIIAAIQERGTFENTILVFTADHGMAVGEHGNIAKGQFWEEVARVPFVLRIPGLTDDGVTSDALVQLIDLYPTLLDVVGGKPAAHLLGQSLLQAIKKPGKTVRDAAFCEIHHDGSLDYMVRTERYKWFVEKGDESLFDLEIDPNELNNLIKAGGHDDVVTSMHEHLRNFLMTGQINYSQGYRPVAERVKGAE